jgi:hypothetical protein
MSEGVIHNGRIWYPTDFKGEPYAARTHLFATMKIDEAVLFWADTYNLYASIRSSAYGYATSKRKKFRTKRQAAPANPLVVRVWRES